MSEETRKVEESVEMSRGDFLKAAGLGLGMAGVPDRTMARRLRLQGSPLRKSKR